MVYKDDKETQDKSLKKVYTVTELTSIIKNLLETEFVNLTVKGELTGFKRYPSGHLYFSIKDENKSVISCTMWRNSQKSLGFEPKDGDSVIITGRVSFYPPQGKCHIVADSMKLEGIGDLYKKFEQIRKKLEAEGLFDEKKKRPIPNFSKKIGIVTSSESAAIKDMLRTIERRFKGLHIVIADAAVQGESAKRELINGLEKLNKIDDIDLIIIGRGGGSIEDLFVFNEEDLVRAIASSTKVVISAVGHERDFTLSDFAADLRASTPTAAAELATPDKDNLRAKVAHIQSSIDKSMISMFEYIGQTIDYLYEEIEKQTERSLKKQKVSIESLGRTLVASSPSAKITMKKVQTTNIGYKLESLLSTKKKFIKNRIENLKKRFSLIKPGRIISVAILDIQKKAATLDRGINHRLIDKIRNMNKIRSVLHLSNPMNMLARGYSIVQNQAGNIVRSVSGVTNQENINVTVSDGLIQARSYRIILQKSNGDNENGSQIKKG